MGKATLHGLGLPRLPGAGFQTPVARWAGPAVRGTDGETSLTVADMGSLFPGAQPPKAHGKCPCKLVLRFLPLLRSPKPDTAGRPAFGMLPQLQVPSCAGRQV